MSGIAGFLRLDQSPAEPNKLESMLEAIKHRGTGASGRLAKGAVGMGHQWIAPDDTSSDAPFPFRCPHSGRIVTADIRLDNAAELQHALGLPERSLSNRKEERIAQLLLAAHDTWGSACPDHLRGDFAFAIADPVKRTLFLARDPFGIRPLVYHLKPGTIFAFASEATALLALPEVPKLLNRQRVADYLVPWLDSLDFHSTFFQNLYRLPPGSALTITRESEEARPERWFSLDPEKEELRFANDDEYKEAFLSEIQAAVSRCLDGVGPVGAMLSGGLDSSSIVAVANQTLKNRGLRPLETISAISASNPPGPETRSISEVIQRTKVTAYRFEPLAMEALQVETREAIQRANEPTDFHITVLPLCFSASSRAGHRTLMSGVDGDFCIGPSMRYLIYYLREKRFQTTLREVIGLSQNTGSSWRYAADLFRYSIASAFFPVSTRKSHRKRKVQERLNASIISPEFAKEFDVENRVRAIYDLENPFPEPASLRHRQAHLLQCPLVTNALERYDRNAHRFSLEAAHPLMDRQLIEFCLRLPADQIVRNGWTKWILREAMKDQLPEQTRKRRDGNIVNPEFSKSSFLNLLQNERTPTPQYLERLSPYLRPESISQFTEDFQTGSWQVEKNLFEHRSLWMLNQWLTGWFPANDF